MQIRLGRVVSPGDEFLGRPVGKQGFDLRLKRVKRALAKPFRATELGSRGLPCREGLGSRCYITSRSIAAAMDSAIATILV